MNFRRYLRPSALLRRKALRSGLFGGERRWQGVLLTMFLWGRIKRLFGGGEPAPVYTTEAEPGQLFVVAHENDKKSRKAKRKQQKKQSKAEAKAAAKLAKKDAKAAKKQAKKDIKRTARAAKKAERQAA